ncbi:MAG: hypothetical protein ACE5ES_00980 [Candidatus Nanoarchaeia archaeon]
MAERKGVIIRRRVRRAKVPPRRIVSPIRRPSTPSRPSPSPPSGGSSGGGGGSSGGGGGGRRLTGPGGGPVPVFSGGTFPTKIGDVKTGKDGQQQFVPSRGRGPVARGSQRIQQQREFAVQQRQRIIRARTPIVTQTPKAQATVATQRQQRLLTPQTRLQERAIVRRAEPKDVDVFAQQARQLRGLGPIKPKEETRTFKQAEKLPLLLRPEAKLKAAAKERKGTFLGGQLEFAAESAAFGRGVVTSLVVDPFVFAKGLVTEPIKTVRQTATGVKQVVTDPFGTGAAVGEAFKTKPSESLGRVAGIAAFPSAVRGTGRVARETFVRAGTKLRPTKQVVAPSVLAGKETLPTTPSPQAALRTFTREAVTETVKIKPRSKPAIIRKTEFTPVITAAPSPLKTAIQPTKAITQPKEFASQVSLRARGRILSGETRKSALDLEDPGIFVTPSTKASPAFLRLEPTTASQTKLTLNPFKSSRPAFTEIKVSRVEAADPRAVRALVQERARKGRSGFEAGGFGVVRPILESRAKEGKAFVTVRSTVRDTPELEAVIPKSSVLIPERPTTLLGRIKGFEEFTVVEGRAIPILKFRTKREKGRQPSIFDDVVERRIIRRASRPSSDISKGVTFKTPFPETAPVSSALSRASRVSRPSVVSGVSTISTVSRPSIPSTLRSGISDTSTPSKPSRPSRPSRPSKVSRPIGSSVVSVSRLSAPSNIIPSKPSKPSPVSKPTKGTSLFALPTPSTPRQFRTRVGPRKRDPEGRKVQGHNVIMFERGKRVKANIKPLPRDEAERLGKDIAENSLSASFKVTPTKVKAPAARRSPLATGGFVSPGKFRESRDPKRKGFFVEKSRFRLDTPGEIRGITAAKLISQRKKSLKRSKSQFSFGF